jgi:hypothetical protein
VLWYALTGNPQPAYKLEGMKILMEFPKPKDEEQAANAMPEVERKQVCVAAHDRAVRHALWRLLSALLVAV